MSVIDELRGIAGDRVVESEPMAAHTTLGVGGPAEYYVEAASEDELAALMGRVSAHGLAWLVIGDGANLLVSDKGVRGVVIRLSEAFEQASVDGVLLKAGAGAKMTKVADAAAQHNLSGFESLGTVPGTVGGAIVMNAGTHRGYIDEVVLEVAVVTVAGERLRLAREECGFSYRTSRFQKDHSMIVTSAVFELRAGDGASIRAEMDRLRRRRMETQPQGKSAGCFFKNPPGESAGRLIELAGGKGLSEGGAVVSHAHANFIVNAGRASASDLYALAERVRKLVREKTGVELEHEVRLVGEW